MKENFSAINLKIKANLIRQDIIKMLAQAGSGHPAGSLGMADIMTALYFKILNHNPKKPNWPERDRLILSNGHIVPVRYAAMARAGYFSTAKLKTLRKLGSPLQGHPSLVDFPEMECSSGPLGQGISIAVGMAMAAKMDKSRTTFYPKKVVRDKKNYQIYCTMGDGELDEGQCWEALMLAAKYHLNNLTVIVDRNNIQLDGPTEQIMPLDPLAEKIKAFNWQVVIINGHEFKEIIKACQKAKKQKSKPLAIIAKTVPGKGVSFMEGKYEWHGMAPNMEQAKIALAELQVEYNLLKGSGDFSRRKQKNVS